MQCENGRIILSIQQHNWSKSVVAERILSVDDFVTAVNKMLDPNREPTNSSVLEADKENCVELVSTNVKRHRVPSSLKSPSKKLKYIDNSVDEEIERHKKGILKNLCAIYHIIQHFRVENFDDWLAVHHSFLCPSLCFSMKPTYNEFVKVFHCSTFVLFTYSAKFYFSYHIQEFFSGGQRGHFVSSEMVLPYPPIPPYFPYVLFYCLLAVAYDFVHLFN